MRPTQGGGAEGLASVMPHTKDGRMGTEVNFLAQLTHHSNIRKPEDAQGSKHVDTRTYTKTLRSN